jgi:hypothetical protein
MPASMSSCTREREFRAIGGHETVEPCPSVSSYRQKFMHLGLDLSQHGQIVARGKRSRGRTAREQTESTKLHGPSKLAADWS